MELIGNGPAMARLRKSIREAGRSDAAVLIQGDTGTGKELVALAIHRESNRRRKSFVPVNCMGFPDELLESELFGHTKGSFTGADRDTAGKIRQSEGGSLFLDEIGDVSPHMQVLMLRFLESHEIQPIGGIGDSDSRIVNTRIIAATNVDLRKKMADGEFREDFFYRIDVLEVKVPPLRERPEDIVELCEESAHDLSKGAGHKAVSFAPGVLQALHNYHWPGNIRELRNMVDRFLARTDREHIELQDVPSEVLGERSVSQELPASERNPRVEECIKRMQEGKESFWDVVHRPYIEEHALTRDDLVEIVKYGLTQTHGHYTLVCKLFNIERTEYDKLVSFLKGQHAYIAALQYRQ